MRLSCGVVAFGVTSLVSAHTARADHASIHATGSGDIAVTDNVFAAPDGSRESDMFFQVRPGILFAYDAPRMIHELTAELEILEYIQNSDQPSLNFRGGWRGIFTPGPRSEVSLGLDGGTGKVSALTARQTPDQTTVAVVPTGEVSVQQANASESASYQTTRETRVSQNGLASFASTDDGLGTTDQSYTASFLVGFERTWKSDSLGISAGVSYLHLEHHAPMGALLGDRLDQQVNPQLTANYRHDFSTNWSASADGGVVYVNPVGTDPFNPMDTTRNAQLYPVAGVQGSYTDLWGRASLSARRGVSPNLLIAQNTVNTGVVAQLSVPLPWLDDSRRREPKLVAAGTIGYEQTELIDNTTDFTAGIFDVFRVDVGVAYSPRPGMTYGLRYEFLHQTGDASATMVVPDFTRNTLFFTFAFRYPDRLAVAVPRQRATSRVDRSDLSATGEEPVVPEAVEDTEHGGGGGSESGGGNAGGTAGHSIGGGAGGPAGSDDD